MIREAIEKQVLDLLSHEDADVEMIRRQLSAHRLGTLCDMHESPIEFIDNRAVFHIARDFRVAIVLWREAYVPQDFATRDEQVIRTHMVMSDIGAYQAVAIDAATGKPPVITSRSRHREFLKRNGYVELGNEPVKKQEYRGDHDVRGDLTKATREVLSRHH